MSNSKFVRTLRTPSGAIGFLVLLVVASVAVLGPFVAPYDPTLPLDAPSMGPSTDYLLGTDFLGRDVLSRLFCGGASVVTMGLVATVASYLVALTIGMYAGYVGGLADSALMRPVDVILAFPPLIILLLLVGGLQPQPWVLVLGVVVVQLPSIARISRAATLSVARTNYVEAAKARGDHMVAIIRRDVLPNILQTVVADFGIRFGLSIILIASMNYLGLGIQPPASDWGLMISENQAYISLNPWAVVAPATMLALITIGVNLFADAYMRVAYTSTRPKRVPTVSTAKQNTTSAAAPDMASPK